MAEWTALGASEICAVVLMEAGETRALYERLREPRPALIGVSGADWNDDFTPWPTPSVFRGRADFGGDADAFLKRLTEDILPEAEAALPVAPKRRMLAGYSLAGLFAMYAAGMGAFDEAASVSGSMWYESFLPWLEKAPAAPRRAYFSVGEREKEGRNHAFRTIEDCTRRAAEILHARGAQTIFERNPGGHFDDPTGRMARAIEWLIQCK